MMPEREGRTVTELRVIQNCDRCVGDNAEEGCPSPREEVPEVFEMYWPPSPDPDSWTSDTPNEGISYENHQGHEGICSYGADYHGFYLLEPGSPISEFEVPTDTGRAVPYYGEQDPKYIEAYLKIQSAVFAGIEIREAVRFILTELGWRLVESCEIVTEEATIYWKWKE